MKLVKMTETLAAYTEYYDVTIYIFQKIVMGHVDIVLRSFVHSIERLDKNHVSFTKGITYEIGNRFYGYI